jgi:hypothetical protein
MASIPDNPPLGRSLKGRLLPKNWEQHQYGPAGFWYAAPGGMDVIESVGDPHEDGSEWLHISASYPDRVPSWEDLRFLKSALVGPDADAIIVFPKQREYVNIHPNVLHLWSRLDADSAPHFAMEIAPGRFSI